MRTKKICSHLKIHSKEFFVHKFTHGILKKKIKTNKLLTSSNVHDDEGRRRTRTNRKKN